MYVPNDAAAVSRQQRIEDVAVSVDRNRPGVTAWRQGEEADIATAATSAFSTCIASGTRRERGRGGVATVNRDKSLTAPCSTVPSVNGAVGGK